MSDRVEKFIVRRKCSSLFCHTTNNKEFFFILYLLIPINIMARCEMKLALQLKAGWPEDWGKITQIWGKEAKTIAKLKNGKVFSSKLNWKVKNVFIKCLLNS
jgi:hypothetical protein